VIDFHCHLDHYPGALKLLPQVAERNSFTLVVTTSPRAWQATSRVFSGYDNIAVALGMHPEIVARKSNEREMLISSISQARFIGEVGIDGSSQHRGSALMQEAVFRDVLLECERVGGRVLSIHSRNAAGRVLDLIHRHCNSSTPVLHWFSGTHGEAKRAVALGCWFSVGPAMLAGAKGRRLLREIPMDRILPETDGPFARKGDRPLLPWEAIEIVGEVACLWQREREDVVQQMRQNLSTVLGEL
jgi:TatD DNase family protein